MNKLTLVLAVISAPLVIAATDIHTFAIWFLCFGVTMLLCLHKTVNSIIIRNKSNTIVNSFLILSIFGCILNLDNVNNFGTVFGYALDDERYFSKIKMFVVGAEVKECGLFEFVFGSIAFVLDKTIAPDFSITNLLPINWLLGSVVCYLCQLLACRVTGQEVPGWVIFVSLLLNYQYIDAFIRLYREALLYCFYVYALLLMSDKRHIKSLPFILMSGLVRGSNGFFLVLFGGLNFIRQKIKNTAIFLTVVMVFTLLAIQIINQTGDLLFDYASDFSRGRRYRKAYSHYSLEDRLKSRQESLKGGKVRSSITSEIYHVQGVAALLGKPAISFFFPLTLHSLIETRYSSSPHATNRTATGIFFFNIVEYLMIMNWIIVFPLFAIGFCHYLFCRGTKQIMAIFFLTTLALVANISGQMRHGIAFFVLMPCFVASGFSLYRSSSTTRNIAYCLGSIMFLGICALNIFKVY